MIEFFLGTVKERVVDDENNTTKEDFIILADIPGIAEGVKAFPTKDNLDEPKVGDQVLLTSYDSFYHSYFTYRKLKENDFIGFRAAGKMIDITPDKITIGVFDESNDTYKDDERPDCSNHCSIEMDKDGNITVHSKGDITVNVDKKEGENGNLNINVEADCNITSKGKVTIKGAPEIELNGGNNKRLVNEDGLNTLLGVMCSAIDTVGGIFNIPPTANSTFEALKQQGLYDNNITH